LYLGNRLRGNSSNVAGDKHHGLQPIHRTPEGCLDGCKVWSLVQALKA
jgi:hypothetical protein